MVGLVRFELLKGDFQGIAADDVVNVTFPSSAGETIVPALHPLIIGAVL